MINFDFNYCKKNNYIKNYNYKLRKIKNMNKIY